MYFDVVLMAVVAVWRSQPVLLSCLIRCNGWSDNWGTHHGGRCRGSCSRAGGHLAGATTTKVGGANCSAIHMVLISCTTVAWGVDRWQLFLK